MICDTDCPLNVLTCWWIALKFEGVDFSLPVRVLTNLIGLRVELCEIVLHEAYILERLDFQIPYNTRMRSVYESVEVHNAKTTLWMFAILLLDSAMFYTTETLLSILTGFDTHLLFPPDLYIETLSLPGWIFTGLCDLIVCPLPRICDKRQRGS